MIAVEHLSAGERPRLRRPRQFDWNSLINQEIHPIKVAAVEALRAIGGPLSARELWLIGIGAEAAYGTVAYHVRALADSRVIVQTHKAPARGSEEKFYVLRNAED